jgi:hypothetical protein
VEKLKLYRDQVFDGLRSAVDPLADPAVLELVKAPEIVQQINAWQIIPENLPQELPEPVQKYLEFYQKPFVGLDTQKIKRAQGFFSQNGNRYLALLGFYSLPYCYAFADGAKVLYRSKRIMSNPGERLFETASFIIDSFEPGTFLENNKALLTLAKVRLVHGFARHFIEKHDKSWNPQWGRPINQEDMIGTNLAFSFLVIRGFRKLGKPLSVKEAEDLLYYWKVMGHYLGIDISFWPETLKEANELERLIRRRHMRSSEEGKELLKNLVAHFKMGEQPLAAFSDKLIAFFVGEQAAMALDLQHSALPQPLMGRLLNLGLVPPVSKQSYGKLRSEFRLQSKTSFGKEVKIEVPLVARRA